MTLTVVIHLLAASVARDGLAGRLEVVSTGQVLSWGSADELLTHLNDLHAGRSTRAVPPAPVGDESLA